MTEIPSMFLAQYWRLETSSRPFYTFIKVPIQRDLVIFNNWHLPFLMSLIYLYKKKRKKRKEKKTNTGMLS